MKKFELTSEQKINWSGRTLYRIRACPFCGGDSDYQQDSEVVTCQKCGACAPSEIWNQRV